VLICERILSICYFPDDYSQIEMLTPKTISGTERRYNILQRINQQSRITVSEVCDQFAVSQATARRDLETLAGNGKVQRVHGGAIAIEKAPPEMPMLQRQVEQMGEKQRIGALAASRVKDGEAIFLGSGTTVLEVARNLIDHRLLTVITNSLPVVMLLSEYSNITIICIGGYLRASELSLIGHIAEQELAEVHADRVFIGVRAINISQGLTNDYLPETLTDRAILTIGKENIVVADHTKFNRTSTVRLVPISQIHTLITGVETSEEIINEIVMNHIQVFTA
jgi:DeoR/GlpR family transcriptional regulator of sugar metabolism